MNFRDVRHGQDVRATFERVVVINLARRADRLERFSKRMEGNWPFAEPRRFEAVDGAGLALPATWKQGAGAWGCLQSHRAVLDAAIADGVSSLLVLEDDAYPVDDLPGRARLFLARVPEDWNCLMLGAEHLLAPVPVGPGVVRCVASIRCHAYAVRGPLMQMLSAFWQCNQTDHCDLVLSSLMQHFKAYAPDPLLIGQEAGLSDITPKHFPLRFLAPGKSPQASVTGAGIDPKLRKIMTPRVRVGNCGTEHGQDARAYGIGGD